MKRERIWCVSCEHLRDASERSVESKLVSFSNRLVCHVVPKVFPTRMRHTQLCDLQLCQRFAALGIQRAQPLGIGLLDQRGSSRSSVSAAHSVHSYAFFSGRQRNAREGFGQKQQRSSDHSRDGCSALYVMTRDAITDRAMPSRPKKPKKPQRTRALPVQVMLSQSEHAQLQALVRARALSGVSELVRELLAAAASELPRVASQPDPRQAELF
jgi:hypothetical protein